MSNLDLSTTYLGLRLSNPFIAGASPLGDDLDTVRRLEDAGCAAIVLRSVFEEQISEARNGRIHEMDPLDSRFARVVSYFPKPESYVFTPDTYLEHLRRVKAAVRIPVIGSINGISPRAWMTFAKNMQEAGADAVELNMYELVTDLDQGGESVEYMQREIVKDLKHELRIPLAVKLLPYFTAFAHVARGLEKAGADGLVLFNRFLQPDIDLESMAVRRTFDLSTNAELPIRLRWLAILRGQLACSLAATGGVELPADAIKALLCGADAVQLVSTILRRGPSYIATMRAELSRWMAASDFGSLSAVCGRLRISESDEASWFERAQYIRVLQTTTG